MVSDKRLTQLLPGPLPGLPNEGYYLTRFSMSSRCFERTLLIDADDTLWENNVFYRRCTTQFQDHMESLGCDRDTVLEVLNACERETIPISGYGPASYVTALGKACRRLLRESDKTVPSKMIAKARSFGEPLLSAPIALIADVESTLIALRPSSRLVLATKGDEVTQQAKIDRSRLGPLFDAQYIVPEKDVDTYRRIVVELELDLESTWMVGNSPKSDINPATEAGLGALFIPHDQTWTAEQQEMTHPDLVVTLHRFADLVAFFGIEVPAKSLSGKTEWGGHRRGSRSP